MIFVTVGSQKFQFNRLLIKIDELIESGVINEEVFAQTGYSDYSPKNYEFKPFLDRKEISSIMEKSTTVITHGGTGAIIGAIKLGKKVIAVPRMAIYGEHVDDHQLQLINQFKIMNLIFACNDIELLDKAIEITQITEYVKYTSNTDKIISSIESYLMTNVR